MSRLRLYARNLTANWVGYVANLVVMFFLSPFIVHSLGPLLYGLWSVLISVTSFFCVAELGVRGGLGRFMNYYLGRSEIQKVNRVINTSIVFFIFSGLIILCLTVVLVKVFDVLFPSVPDNILPLAKLALALLSVHLWLSFFHASFSQILTAVDRFDLYNVVNVAVLLLQAGGTVILLSRGRSIVALALLHIITTSVGLVLSYFLAKKAFSVFRLDLTLASFRCFKEMFGYNLWSLVGKLAFRFLYWLDIILIGMLLGSKQVTYYAIAAMLIFHSRNLVLQSSYILTPQIVKECARKNWFNLQRLFTRGSNMVMGIGIPLFVGFIVFGKEFVSLWMGDEYLMSYRILFILAIAQLPSISAMLAGPIFGGLNKIHLEAIFTIVESVLNVIFSVLFVVALDFGIEGVAWGTLISRVGISILAVVVVINLISISKEDFIQSVVARWLLLGAVFFLVCFALRELVGTGSWMSFLSKVFLALTLYVPLMWMTLLSKEDKRYAMGLLGNRMAA